MVAVRGLACSSFDGSVVGEGERGKTLRTVLGVGLEVEVVDWVAYSTDLASGYCCCGSSSIYGCCESALREEQEWCKKSQHDG